MYQRNGGPSIATGWIRGASGGVRGPILRPGCFIKYLHSTVLLSDTLQNSCRLARYGRRLKSPSPFGHNFTNRGAGNDVVSARSGAIITDWINISVKKVSSQKWSNENH